MANYPSGTPGAASLSNPAAAFIAGGRLFVVDTGNNRVLIWNSVPSTPLTPANVVLGQTSFSGDNAGVDTLNGGVYTLAMRQPSAGWASGTRLLVVDAGNNRVLSWNGIPSVNNRLPDTFMGQTGPGQAVGGAGIGQFTTPLSVTSDGVAVFVADAGNNRVLEFGNYIASAGNAPAADHVFGQEDFAHITYNDEDQNNQPDTTPGQGTLHTPVGVAVANGQLYVTDSGNSRVLGFSSTSGSTGSP